MRETTLKEKITILLQIVTMGMAINAIVSLNRAYTLLSNNVNDYNDIISNWETKPITAVSMTDTEACSGNDQAVWTDMTFPGLADGVCACPSSSRFSSSISACNATKINDGCKQQSSYQTFSMKRYKGKTICVERDSDSEASVLSWKNFKERPHPKNGECIENYKYCGPNNGNYDEDAAVCVPSDTSCPLTEIKIEDSLTDTNYVSIGAFANFQVADSAFDEDHSDENLYSRTEGREDDKFAPIVDIKFAFVDNDEDRGICYGDDDSQSSFNGKYTWTQGASGEGGRPVEHLPGTCSSRKFKYDTRYELIDSYEVNQYLMEAVTKDDACDVHYTMTSQEPNYWNNGLTSVIGCPSSSTPAGKCSMTTSLNCENTDYICKDILYQSTCGLLMESAKTTATGSSSRRIGLFVRRQIQWTTTCKVDKAYVYNLKDPINDAKSAQMALLVINIIINIIISFFFPIVIITNLCCGDAPCIPGEGEAERKIIKASKTKIGHALRVIKAIPMIICVIVISGIVNKLKSFDDIKCSDAMTNKTFDDIAETLPDVMSSNINALVMDILQILLFAGMALKEHFSGDEDEEAELELAKQKEDEEANVE